MPHLVLDCDGVDVITHKVVGDVVAIGRAPSNDVVIDDPTVSAEHALLTKSPTGYRLKDLSSTNGTQINGISVTDAELEDGAEVRFGYVTGIFQDATEKSDPAPELARPSEHDALAEVAVSETQSIFRPRTPHESVSEFRDP
jgi:pSer/pThr/pTyr-binding forkhead associated (FHA) protein